MQNNIKLFSNLAQIAGRKDLKYLEGANRKIFNVVPPLLINDREFNFFLPNYFLHKK